MCLRKRERELERCVADLTWWRRGQAQIMHGGLVPRGIRMGRPSTGLGRTVREVLLISPFPFFYFILSSASPSADRPRYMGRTSALYPPRHKIFATVLSKISTIGGPSASYPRTVREALSRKSRKSCALPQVEF